MSRSCFTTSNSRLRRRTSSSWAVCCPLPEIRAPEQWTEDLALRLRSHLCSWSYGQYAGNFAQRLLEAQERLGNPLQAISVTAYLIALRRFFTDLSRRPHALPGEPARRISLPFDPKETLSTPNHLKRAIDEANPRDIDLRVWAKLAIAAATLSQSDLPQGAKYPLSLYRALALLWVTSARRPNEIVRLRLDCLREDWDQDMLDEDNQAVERPVQDLQAGKEPATIFYLHIPPGKNFRYGWIWIPAYTAEAITAWKRERAPEHDRFRIGRRMSMWITSFATEIIGRKHLSECLPHSSSVCESRGRQT